MEYNTHIFTHYDASLLRKKRFGANTVLDKLITTRNDAD